MSTNTINKTDTKLQLDLSRHTDKYDSSTLQLNLTNKVNFIFGRNGTGKTTIANEINKQFSSSNNVLIFKDFDGVIENERLNAISLGVKNKELQIQIDDLDKIIASVEQQIFPPVEKGTTNVYTRYIEAKSKYTNQVNRIESFYTKSASEIKNLSNPQLAKTTYNKKDFIQDINNANTLSSDIMTENQTLLKADKKQYLTLPLFPHLNLADCLKDVNELLTIKLSQRLYIQELQNDTRKQNFAKLGLDVHEHKSNEICAFCGNIISEERWIMLENYFNDEVKKLNDRINKRINDIDIIIGSFKTITIPDDSVTYDKFKNEIRQLRNQINVRTYQYRDYFSALKDALVEKKDNPFIGMEEIDLIIPDGFTDIEDSFKIIIKKHKHFTDNLSNEQDGAKNALRCHEVSRKLIEFNYIKEKEKLNRFESVYHEALQALDTNKANLKKIRDERSQLIIKTRDEENIVIEINRLMRSMGNVSFSLKLVKDDSENQKGQYQIEGYNKIIRPITQLSKGEKNIIAFLYFILSINSLYESNNPRIIVLDDPMTSNDDSMQYLMISEIRKLYEHLRKEDYLILLTHNCHFYLNVRPYIKKEYEENGKKVSFYQKYGNYILLSDGKLTKIKQLSKGKDDLCTSYEMLWKELNYLYETEGATSDLMLNPCRRICETFMNFTKIDSDKFYGNNLSAKKLFDVNQHSIDDFEAEVNGKTKNEIKSLLQELFNENNASDHFSCYWRPIIH